MKALPVRRLGKDQRVGRYISAEGGGGIFAGYTKCEHGIDHKVLMTPHEIRELSRIAGYERAHDGWKVRIAKRIQKWANSVIMRAATRA